MKSPKIPRVRFPLLSPLFPLLCLLLLAGCPKSAPEPKAGPERLPLEGMKLRLAVAGDPALAAAVVQARGEWNAQTGAELEVVEIAAKELEGTNPPQADAVIFPSHSLCFLAEKDWIEPVPKKIIRGEQWGGIFDLPKLREAAWGGRIMTVPFGSPVFCCYYRADLLEKLGRRPPQTWEEYQELAELLAKNSPFPSAGKGPKLPPPLPLGEGSPAKSPLSLGEGSPAKSPLSLGEGSPAMSPLPLGEGQGVRAQWSATIEPLAPGWAGLTLLARAAPFAKHHDNFSTLFNIDTMDPLIAGEPFVKALEDLAAAAKLGPRDPLQFDPAKVRAAFWRGECGLALTWPTAADLRGEKREERREKRGLAASAASDSFDESLRVGFVQLPGAPLVYNMAEKKWVKRADSDDHRVPLLAVSGRLGAVLKKSANRAAAFQLLLWLSDDRMSPQISALSPATTMFRQSNLDAPGQWVEDTVPHTAAAQYGTATLAAFSHEQWLAALRIPGRVEYLAALDEAVAASRPRQKIAAKSPRTGRRKVAQNHRPPRPGKAESRLSAQPRAGVN